VAVALAADPYLAEDAADLVELQLAELPVALDAQAVAEAAVRIAVIRACATGDRTTRMHSWPGRSTSSQNRPRPSSIRSSSSRRTDRPMLMRPPSTRRRR
jgi:CO/xanthine dehydrogenase Mo-binding subunit